MRRPLLFLVLPACLIAAAVGASPSVDDIRRLLAEKDIAFDAEKVRKSSVDGLLKGVDPGAAILTREQVLEAARMAMVETAEEWPEDLCYLKLRGMVDVGKEAVDRIRAWSDIGKAGVILDLRSAGGDSLEAADRLADRFVSGENRTLYRLRNTHGRIVRTHNARPGPRFRLPLIVLADRGTCGASEVLASALKGRTGVLLVGAPTAGDPAVRETIPLTAGYFVRMATHRVVACTGVDYEGKGVLPDIAVAASGTNAAAFDEPSEEDVSGRTATDRARKERELMRKVAGDPTLQRAVDILLGLKSLGRSAWTHEPETTPDTANAVKP